MTKLSVSVFRDCFGTSRSVGEIWYDRSGNECYFRDNGTISCRTINNEPSLTIQSEKDTCDINQIVNKFGLTKSPISSISRALTQQGYLAPIQGGFGDFTNVVDYHDAINRAQQAQDAFMELPAAVRARFSNDPGKLIDFLSDDKNRSEAVELGLISASVSAPQASKVPQGADPASSPLDVTGGTDTQMT